MQLFGCVSRVGGTRPERPLPNALHDATIAALQTLLSPRRPCHMDRRNFVVSSALGAASLAARKLPSAANISFPTGGAATRKILIAGGNFNTSFIRYMAQLTGKPRPKLLYLPTASADSPGGS